MKRLCHSWPARVAAFLLASAIPLSAAQFTAHWTNSADGNWSNPANWDINRVPNNGGGDMFNVVWDANPVTITLDVPVTISNFTFTINGTLAGDGLVRGNALSILGDFTWTAGKLAGISNEFEGALYGHTIVRGKTTIHRSPGKTIALDRQILDLCGTNTLDDVIVLDHSARLVNQTNALFEVLAVGHFQSSNATPFAPNVVGNSGAFRFLPSATPATFQPLFSSGGSVDVLQRTVALGNDASFYLLTGNLQLQNARLQGLPTVNVASGTLSGTGQVDQAGVGGTLTGQLLFQYLTLGPQAGTQIKIGGRNPGQFDHVTIQNYLALNGKLEVNLINGFETNIQSSDVFEVMTLSSGLYVSGKFTNVTYGQRLLTSDGNGSFLVVTNSSRSVFLRDWASVSVSGLPLVYPLSGGGILVAAAATLTGLETVDWANATLSVTVTNSAPDIVTNTVSVRQYLSITNQGGITLDANGAVAFNGTAVGTLSTNASGENISIAFNGNATLAAAQALLRNLTYRLDGFGPNAFLVPETHFADRAVALKLKAGSGTYWIANRSIQFPCLVGFHCEPAVIAKSGNEVGGAILMEDFSNGESFEASFIAYSQARCATNIIFSVNDSPGAVSFLTGRELGTCAISVSFGPFESHLDVSVNDTCTMNWFQFARSILFPAYPSGSLRRDPADSTLSLASLHALQALMNQTEAGQRLTTLYWQHTRELVALLGTNISLTLQAAQVVSDFQAPLVALLSGNGSQAQITQAMIDELNSVWSQVAALASPELKAAMQTERGRFNNFQDFVGKNFSQWAGLLQIPAPTQPWIFLSRPRLINGQFSVEANYVTNLQQQLWRTADFKDWAQVVNARLETNGYTLGLTDTNAPATNRFYRILAAPPGP